MLKSKPPKGEIELGKKPHDFFSPGEMFFCRGNIFLNYFARQTVTTAKRKDFRSGVLRKSLGGKLFCLDTKTFPFHNRFDMPNADVKN